MEVLRGSFAIAVTLSLLMLCSGCAAQHGPSANIPAGPSVVQANSANKIPAGPGVVPIGTKHFEGVK